MISTVIAPDTSISLWVKQVLIFEDKQGSQKTSLPFFADGFPGLIFHETENGLFVNPHNKKMPSLFLYGQTIEPVELVLHGHFRLIVFQLFPFVLKSFFKVDPLVLKDQCFDVTQLENNLGMETKEQLEKTNNWEQTIQVMSALLLVLFKNKLEQFDTPITRAIQKIIEKKGQVQVRELYEDIQLTERTFERRFFSSVGITAKQFSKIIQFQQSLEQLSSKDYKKLTDVVYANGYADQSHFIKVFKEFTGKTPNAFKTKK